MELWLELVALVAVLVNLALILIVFYDIRKQIKEHRDAIIELELMMENVEKAFAKLDDIFEQLKELMRK